MKQVIVALLMAVAVQSASVAVLRPNCFQTDTGCKCNVKEGLEETVREYDNIYECQKPVELQTAENKKALNAEIEEKFGGFKENCFPKPSGGCKCNVDEGHGETVREYSEDADCKKSLEAQTAEHKKELNEEMKEKFGDFKENCFPKPSGGCNCNEKDADGNEATVTYNDPTQCKVRSKRDVSAGVQTRPSNVNQPAQKYRSGSADAPSQNVRDPVRERAQANYAKVVEELNTKFKGLREGCYPRPKGCLCVTGKTADGREITKRLMTDMECKCAPGSKGCPV